MREMYNSIFDIVDFDDEDRPYSIVEIGPKDGFNKLSPTYARIREYRIYSINERYGVSLLEFLEMPRHITDMLIEESRESVQINQKLKKGVENDTRKQLKREGYDISKY